MNQALVRALSEIMADPKRPHSTCPGYDHWLANKIWEACTKYCAEMSGPECSEAILDSNTQLNCTEIQVRSCPEWVGFV